MNEYLIVHLSAFSEVTFTTHQRTLKQHLSILLWSNLKRYFSRKIVTSIAGRVLQIFHFTNDHSLKLTLKSICSTFYSNTYSIQVFRYRYNRYSSLSVYNTRRLSKPVENWRFCWISQWKTQSNWFRGCSVSLKLYKKTFVFNNDYFWCRVTETLVISTLFSITLSQILHDLEA